MEYIEKTAKTIEEAIELALSELNIKKENADIEILEEPSRGFLGIIGSKDAKVRVKRKEVKKEVKKDIKKEVGKEESSTREIEREVDKEVAYNLLRNILNAMDVKAEIKISFDSNSMKINVIGPGMGIIIGRRGQTLDALQYLLVLAVNKNRGRDGYTRVILDTENYRKKREETLIRLANRLANKTVRSRKRVELEPMNPYERRIIHFTLQNYPGVITYSEGEEPYRKVIIACK